jgi:hypothetical protein
VPIASSIVSKRTYIARETTPGVRSAPNLWLQGLNIRIVSDSTRGEVRPSGSTLRTSRPLVQNWSTFTIAAGSYLDYNSLLYPLAAMLGLPTTSTPAGGTLSREHAFLFASDGSVARAIFSFAAGYQGGVAEESLRNVFQAFNFTVSRAAAPTIGGNGYGRNLNLSGTLGVNEVQTIATAVGGTPTAGTFTAVYGGGTASIVWNATAGSIATAIAALPGVGTAQIAASGGALPTTPVALTFQGSLANLNVAAIVLDNTGLTGGSYALTTTQPGGVTAVPVRAIQAPEWDIYMDPTPGAIGTTRVRPYTAAFTFSGLTNPDWVIDSTTPSYDDDVLQVPTVTLNLVLRNDAAARVLYAALLAGATYYVRLDAIGPVIEGALRYEFRLDVAVQADANLGQFGDDGGSETIPLPLTIIADSTFNAGGFAALLRNTLLGI